MILDLELEQPDSGMVLLCHVHANPAMAMLPAILYSADVYALRSYREELQAVHCAILPMLFSLDDLLRLIETTLASPPPVESPLAA